MYLKFSVKFLLCVHLVSQQGECSVATEKGPPQRKKKVETVLAKPGEDVKIVCPVYGSPQPIIEWSKVGYYSIEQRDGGGGGDISSINYLLLIVDVT